MGRPHLIKVQYKRASESFKVDTHDKMAVHVPEERMKLHPGLTGCYTTDNCPGISLVDTRMARRQSQLSSEDEEILEADGSNANGLVQNDQVLRWPRWTDN